MKKLKIVFTLMIITLTVSIGAAQEPPPPNDFGERDDPKNRNQLIAEELNLTNEQKAQWRQINRQGRLQSRDAQVTLRSAKEDLNQYIYSDSIDEGTLQTKLRRVVEAQAEVIKIRTRSEVAVRNILSAEQLVKFRTFRERVKKQRQKKLQQQQRRQRRLRRQNNRGNPNQRNRPTQRRNRP